MKCTRKASLSSTPDLCSKQFVLMRECHRPNGPELLPGPDGGWMVAESAAQAFENTAVLRAEPPVVKWGGLEGKVKEVCASLGVDRLRF